MLLRILFLLAITGAAFSCESTEDSMADNLPFEAEAIADRIAASDVFIEAGRAFKELNALMLSDILDNAKTLDDDEAEQLNNSPNVVGFLKDNNYKNAEEIATLSVELEKLNTELVAELAKIEAKIGDEKYAEVNRIIYDKYKHLMRLTPEEGLSISRE